MGRMLNCGKKTLERLFVESDSWRAVVERINTVRIDGTKPEMMDLEKHAELNSVWEIMERDSILIHEGSALLRQVEQNPNLLIQYPKDLFVLELPSATTNAYSLDCGVAVFAEDSHSPVSISKNSRTIDFTKGNEDSWKRCFYKVKKDPQTPVNSMILIDRYLFRDFRQGIANLKLILSEILPDRIKGRFDVLLLFSDGKECLDQRVHDMTWFARLLWNECKNLRRYDINLEILIINDENRVLWDSTHDRRIITNYYRVIASHGFSALGGPGVNMPVWTQTLTIDCAYSGIGEMDETDKFPVEAYDATLARLSSFAMNPGKYEKDYLFYKRGNEYFSLDNLENRLIKH